MFYYPNPYYFYPNVHPQYVPDHRNTLLPDRSTSPHERQYQYPPVDTETLHESVEKFQALMNQADLLIDKLASDQEFSKDLMSSAQEANEANVNKLIKSTGITIEVKTTFTPTGIQIRLDNSESGGGCCDLLIALKW